MPRPLRTGLTYFSHDTDASSDEKLDVLRVLYGNDGYAFFFILLERIYRTVDAELNVSAAETRQILAKKIEVSSERFEQMLATALQYRCFCPECYERRQVLTSPGIKKRAAAVMGKRLREAERYREGQKPADNVQNAPFLVSAAETTQKPDSNPAETRQNIDKGKERKGKEKEQEDVQNPSVLHKPVLADASPAEAAPAIAPPVARPLPKRPKKASEHDPLFQKFWNDYGKKRNLKRVLVIWNRLTPEQQQVAADRAAPYAAATPNKTFRKDPDGWLNGEKFNDEDLPSAPIPTISTKQPGQPHRRPGTLNR